MCPPIVSQQQYLIEHQSMIIDNLIEHNRRLVANHNNVVGINRDLEESVRSINGRLQRAMAKSIPRRSVLRWLRRATLGSRKS